MREMLESLGSDVELGANKALMEDTADMTLLASHLEALDVIDKVSFDLSLARGLDYYTGLIYEMVVADSASRVGSIAAGGRYDNLVDMYGRCPLRYVGISFGVDRIFTILDARRKKSTSNLRGQAQVYIMAFGGKEFDGLLLERMPVARQLWSAEYALSSPPKSSRSRYNSSIRPRACPLLWFLGRTSWRPGRCG